MGRYQPFTGDQEIEPGIRALAGTYARRHLLCDREPWAETSGLRRHRPRRPDPISGPLRYGPIRQQRRPGREGAQTNLRRRGKARLPLKASRRESCGCAGPKPRALFGKNERDCEPVHICSGWRLLASYRWGFQGPSDRRRRDTTFRARRRSFLGSSLPSPVLSTADGESPAAAGQSSRPLLNLFRRPTTYS
jgi:hypothetical protein